MLPQVGSRPIRPLSSVILPRDRIDAIVADAEQFQASEAWYGARPSGQTPISEAAALTYSTQHPPWSVCHALSAAVTPCTQSIQPPDGTAISVDV